MTTSEDSEIEEKFFMKITVGERERENRRQLQPGAFTNEQT